MLNASIQHAGVTVQALQTKFKIRFAIADPNPLYGSGIKNLPDTIIPTNISL